MRKKLLMTEAIAHGKVYNMELELDFKLCSCDLVMINNCKRSFFFFLQPFKISESLPQRETLFSIKEYP